MDQTQKIMLEVYKKFKKICDDNNLRYFAAGGTKLGAVLWGGIIPWDDDIDIVMPIDDMYKLIKILTEEPVKNIDFFDGLRADYSDIIGIKIFDKNTMFTSNNLISRPEAFTGVFIDVFPMVGTPDKGTDEFIDKIEELNDKLYRQRLFGDDLEKTRKMVSDLSELSNKYSFDESSTVVNLANPRREKFDRDEFIDCADKKFVDTTIPVSKFYDEHLKIQYGIYSKDWPEEKKSQNHTNFALVDLDKSFTEYRREIKNSTIPRYIEQLWRYKANLEERIFEIGDENHENQIKLSKEIEIRDAEISKLLKEKDNLSKEIEIRDAEISKLNAELFSMRTSTSWRMTRPVRTAGKIARKLAKK